jgi:hypothetical protein
MTPFGAVIVGYLALIGGLLMAYLPGTFILGCLLVVCGATLISHGATKTTR